MPGEPHKKSANSQLFILQIWSASPIQEINYALLKPDEAEHYATLVWSK